MAGQFSVVDSSWELIDPNPDIHQLFSQFNEQFFWGKLSAVYVQWSPRMTLCAGVCKYHGRNRECSIHLSKPLLSYRPRKDLVETLLHEMIHAYLFVADNDRERESHGPKFHEHMYRINRLTGANITVYHSFHDEVRHFKTHWWKCTGPCQTRPPYFGIVKRSMNRAPGPNDFWYKDHQKNCGGSFIKIKEPSPKKAAVKRKKDSETQEEIENKGKASNKITNYFTSPTSTPSSSAAATSSTMPTSSGPSSQISPQAKISSIPNNVEPFAGRGFVLGSIGNNPGTSSGNSYSRNLFGTNSTTSSSSSSSGTGKTKIGSTATQSQPPRRGEHPLLAKWAQTRKDSTAVPGRLLASKKTETITRPTSSDTWDYFGSGGSSSTSSSSGTGFSSSTTPTITKKPPVEIIDLD